MNITSGEAEREAERMLNEAYGRADDEDEDDYQQSIEERQKRLEELWRMEEQQAARAEAFFRKNSERQQRWLKASIYIPLFLAAVLYSFEKSDNRFLYSVLGIEQITVVRINFSLIAFSGFVWVVRYLQFGIGVLPLPKLLARKENEWAQDSAATSYERTAKLAQLRAKDSGRNQTLSGRARSNGTMSEPRDRLLAEVDRLGRSNTINLAFGLSSTVAGLAILYATVFGSNPSDTTSLEKFLISYLPKFSLIVFIEIFAYFFLGLYKKGLADIKYFQNEITNIESKSVALDAALTFREKDIVASVLEKISNTERNHVLEKGQTTVELEIARSEKESMLKFIKVIPAFAKIFSKEEKKTPREE